MLERMYGNEPTHWDDKLCGGKRLRVIVNALTRMRMCTPKGHMEFEHKGAPVSNRHIMPWFDVPDRTARKDTRSEEHTSELQSLMRISYAVFCLNKKTTRHHNPNHTTN